MTHTQEYSLREVIDLDIQLTASHMKSFREIMLKRMRSEQRKRVVDTYRYVKDLKHLQDRHWAKRLMFTTDGTCYYKYVKDYNAEIIEVRDDVINTRIRYMN